MKKEDPSRPLQQSSQQPPNAQLVNNNSQNSQQQQTQPQQQQQVRFMHVSFIDSGWRMAISSRVSRIHGSVSWVEGLESGYLLRWFIRLFIRVVCSRARLGDAEIGSSGSAPGGVLKTDIGFGIPVEVASETCWCRAHSKVDTGRIRDVPQAFVRVSRAQQSYISPATSFLRA